VRETQSRCLDRSWQRSGEIQEDFLQSFLAISITGFASKNQLLYVSEHPIGIRHTAASGAILQPCVDTVCLLQQPQTVQEVANGETDPDVAERQTDNRTQYRHDQQSRLFTVAEKIDFHLVYTVFSGLAGIAGRVQECCLRD